MTKLVPIVVAAVAGLTLAITGCVVSPSTGTQVTPTGTHASPTSAPQPAALVLTLDDISLVDDAGHVMAVAPFNDPESTLALISDALGSTPVPEEHPPYGFTTYSWDEIELLVGESALVSITSDEAEGLALKTVEGIRVGSTRADVTAFSPWEDFYDADGDGLSDTLGLQSRAAPGMESLARPGEEGLDFVGVGMTGNVVTRITSPSNDWQDL